MGATRESITKNGLAHMTQQELAHRKRPEIENDAAIALALQNDINTEHEALAQTAQGQAMIAKYPIYKHMVRDVEDNRNIHGIYAREIIPENGDEVAYYRSQYAANYAGNRPEKEHEMLKQRAEATIKRLDPNSVWALRDAEKETLQKQINRCEKDNVKGQLPRDGWKREFPKDQKALTPEQLSELRAAQYQLDELNLFALEKQKAKEQDRAAAEQARMQVFNHHVWEKEYRRTQALAQEQAQVLDAIALSLQDQKNAKGEPATAESPRAVDASRRRMMRLKQGENPQKKAQSAFP